MVVQRLVSKCDSLLQHLVNVVYLSFSNFYLTICYTKLDLLLFVYDNNMQFQVKHDAKY